MLCSTGLFVYSGTTNSLGKKESFIYCASEDNGWCSSLKKKEKKAMLTIIAWPQLSVTSYSKLIDLTRDLQRNSCL